MPEERTYLTDSWYAAAHASEVGQTLLPRRICGENIVMFRVSDGSLRVFADYCPHRKLPLSRGALVEDEVECGYHGLRFNGEGRCVFIPAQDNIPAQGLRVKIYPAVERYGLVHVWIGDPDKADPALIPAFPEADDPAWVGVKGYCHVEANYLLVLDNLNDLSHLAYVHKSTFGSGGLNLTPVSVSIDDEVVKTRRWLPGSDQTGFIRRAGRFKHDGPIDREQTSDFLLPSSMVITLSASDIGEPVRPHHIVFNSITPETESSCHYFWSVVRIDSPDDEDLSKFFHDLTLAAFLEDKETIEAQQRAIEEDRSGTPLQAVLADKATLGTRRVISRRLAAQSSPGELEAVGTA